ncbi:hypothetical protein JCM8547_008408 [Rhodosporidiobolus lusitaniae]
MSDVAQALTAESAVYFDHRKGGDSHLEVVEPTRVVGRERSTVSSSSLLVVPGENGYAQGASNGAANGTRVRAVTPPPRKDSLDPDSREGSPEQARARRSPGGSPRSVSSARLASVLPRSSSVSPSKQKSLPLHADGALSQPVFASNPLSSGLGVPNGISGPPKSEFPSASYPQPQQAFPSSPRLVVPPHSSTPSSRPNGRTSAANNTISASSTASNVTSNSSQLSPPTNLSPYPPSNASFVSIDPETTAQLIQTLYARLDAQGVPGDGWDEGKERSRDGIINREAALGFDSVLIQKRRSTVIPMDQDDEAKADHVLRRVDRYGFFSQSHPAALACQHNRLATLSATPLETLPSLKPSKRSAKPNSSSTLDPPPSPPPTSGLMPGQRNLRHRASTMSLLPATAISPETIALETKRIDKWASMLSVFKRDPGQNAQDWSLSEGWWSGRVAGGGGGNSGKYRKLQRRVFKGVPDRWRRAVWGLLMERMASEVASGKVQGRERGKVPSLEELKREYGAYLEQPSVQDVQIDLDVPRTISGHVLFHTRYGQGQRALFHVLHAFGLRSEDIGGYCQGMGPIAATLLCYFEPERAYAGLCRLFDQYQLGHIFAPGFPGLVEAFYVQERLVELLMPDVHAAFAEHFISTSAYATKWYITLFANSVPFATQLRLWDGLLLEGVDFLIITSLAIIWHFQHEFISPSASFESVLTRLSSFFFVESDDALLRWIRKTLRLKGLRSKMNDWRREWQGFVRDGTSAGKVT